MKNSLTLLFSIIIIFIAFPLMGQLEKQCKIEKAYIQTDKPMYRPGDEIWIKASVVNGANQPTILSQSATLEMIKPDGSKLLSKNILIEDGTITDYIRLDKSIAGGIYQLKVKTSWMTELDNAYEYSKEIVIQKYDPPRLLMKIDLDKESYGKGETVNASFNVKDLKDRPISHVGVVFTLFIDGEQTQKLYPKTDKEGKSNVDFKLPNEINTSNLSINAKLSYRGKVESISKRIPVILENIDLQFLPEGGSLLEAHSNVLAFKALTETGDPADIQGEIVDVSGQKITSFSSVHDGMGTVNITPQKGVEYFAKICSPYESSSLIPIKYQVSYGAKISILERSEKKISVKISGKIEKGMKLILSNIYNDVWTAKVNHKKDQNIISIPVKKLPQGIYRLALHSANEPISERLVFLHPKKQMKVTMNLEKEKFGLREKVTAKILTTDFNGKPLSADLGITVVEDKMLSFADDKQGYITTELLLSSELKGEIHEPNYYFDDITEETNEHLDLVMLTHGWRSYLNNSNDEEAFAHFVDQNSYIGQVISQKEHKGIKAKVMVQEQNDYQVSIMETDEEGYFMLPFYKNTTFQVYAKSEKHRALIKTVSMNNLRQETSKKYAAMKEKWKAKPVFSAVEDLAILGNNLIDEKIDYEVASEEEIEILSVSLDEGQLLDEIVVTGFQAPLSAMDVTTSGATITGEAIRSLPTRSINAIAASTAGISVVNGSDISIRGSRTDATVYYVNGVRVSGLIPQMMEENTSKDDIFNRYYTKTHLSSASTPVARQYIRSKHIPSNTRQFYVPQYSKSTPTVRSDFRQTIYWNPSVQTDEKGEAKISFFTSDEITSFSMIAEGLTADGHVGRGLEKIVTVKPLNIDCKLPAYFVLGDTAQLSIVINNDSERDQKISLDVSAPGLEIDFPKTKNSKIKKGESEVFQLQVIAPKDLLNTILKIGVKSDHEQDAFSKSISVLNPYFPQQLSYSGVDSDTFDIQLHSPIMSTLSAEFKTYNPINSALEGIESLLRQPSGCFEQVSSSTYPNVMVYQYLQRDMNANRASMETAMKYIKQGYKKLAAYETTEDGFEWYGRAPANLTLTAYGLLEFLDMNKVYNGVDRKMIKRTVNYLLNKRDGMGGFENAGGRFSYIDQYSQIINAYTLYALTHQDIISVDLVKEYNTAKQQANKADDLYITALTALSAFNLGKTDDYEMFIDKILQSLGQTDLQDITCKGTVMRSGIRDRNIETLSFCALALLKGNRSQRLKVRRIVDHILSSRYGGRFGSTQATCLAIQAILAFSDSTPKIDPQNEGMISTMIDGELLTMADNETNLTDFITKKSHQMQVSYSNPNAKSYEMSIKYMSKVPPSVDNPELGLSTRLITTNCSVADQVSMEILLTNNMERISANPTIILGIPSGMSIQMKQLKELKDAGEIAYFELFDNRLVLYFDELLNLEEKKILLDLKADIAGKFIAPSSCAYPYYDEQNRTWIKGITVEIDDNSKLEAF